MFKSFFFSKRWWVQALSGLIVIVALIDLNVEVALFSTEWQMRFGNILQAGATLPTDWNDIVSDFAIIGTGFFVLDGVMNWFCRIYGLCWREALTKYYTEKWLAKPTMIKDAPQILTDCVNEFTTTTIDYFRQTVRAILSLVVFGPMLWKLSEKFKITFLDTPGALVIMTLVVVIICFGISWLTTIKLKEQQDRNQTNEAVLRDEGFGKLNDNRNLPEARKVIWQMFSQLRTGYIWTYVSLFVNDLWLGAYRQAWTIIPTAFFGKFVTNITMGVRYGVMAQTLSALGEVHGSLVFVAYMLQNIQRYRSVVERLRRLESKLKKERPFWHTLWNVDRRT